MFLCVFVARALFAWAAGICCDCLRLLVCICIRFLCVRAPLICIVFLRVCLV
jgi:hypothetical protein